MSNVHQTLPILALICCVGLGYITIFRGDRAATVNAWMVPAGFSGLFFGWSLYAIWSEGPLGFWPEHIRNLWGNQIFCDLILGISVGWVMLAPRAKALGMKLLPWFVLILCTGNIGLLAMLARFLFLHQRTTSLTL